MDTKSRQVRDEMAHKAQLTREYRERRKVLEKQIARLLAENRVTCAELPEIWENVHRHLLVRTED